MNSGAITEEEMKYLIDKYSGENVDKLFSTELLAHPANSAGPRQHMFSVHYSQHVILDEPETPRYFTGYERTFGKYLDSFYKAKNNYEIIAKIIRHSSFPKMAYMLVVRNLDTKEFDVINVSHYEKLSDAHGYMRPFSYMDDKDVGSRIDKDDMVYKANTLDGFGNYRYGKNLKTAFLLIPEVKDDSVVISESAAKNTTFHLVTKTESIINYNDILLNLYGDMNNYKCIPNIGEDIGPRGILFAIRKMNKRNISADFTDIALQNMYFTDNKFRGQGVVVDIDIKVNDPEQLNSDAHRDQLAAIYADQYRYNKEIRDVLQPIVSNKNNRTTHRLEQALFNATNYINPNIKYSCNSGNFEFAHITIYTAYQTPLISAMKLTNRCGGKAVIGKVWPDENMPVDANGVRADFICSAAGVIGRANVDQLFEQMTNYVSDEILRRMKKCKTTTDSIALLLDYLKTLSPEWGQYVQDVFKRMSAREKDEYLQAMYNSKYGIYMYNPPMNGAITYEKLKEIDAKYKIKVSKVKMCREYHLSPEIQELYDPSEKIEKIREINDNFQFLYHTETVGKGKNKKTVKTITEFDGLNLDVKKNPLKLKNEDYENNKWIDNYVWNDDEINPLEDGPKDITLTEYLDTVQAIAGDFNKQQLLDSQLFGKVEETKARIFRRGDNLVREFVSKYPVMIADIYFMVLKHIPDAGFSVRSLGSVTPLGLPNKTIKKSETGRPYADTCNQFSDMDNCDLKRVCDPAKVARLLAVHSTHPDLRAEMAKTLMFEDPTRLHDLPYSDDQIADTIPVKMMNSYLSAIGVEVLDDDQKDPYEFLDDVKYKTVADLMSKNGILPKDIEVEEKEKITLTPVDTND